MSRQSAKSSTAAIASPERPSMQISKSQGLDQPTRQLPGTSSNVDSPISPQWVTLRKQIAQQRKSTPIKKIFGDSTKAGEVYRWGISPANFSPLDDEIFIELLSRLAADASVTADRFRALEFARLTGDLFELATFAGDELKQSSLLAIAAAALPGLLKHLDEPTWWEWLGTIQELRESWLDQDASHPAYLIATGEIGLTLSLTLQPLPSCRRMFETSLSSIARWAEQPERCVCSALEHPQDVRLVLASVLRCHSWLAAILSAQFASEHFSLNKRQAKQIRKTSDQLHEVARELTTWMLALSRGDGSTAFVPKPDGRWGDTRTTGLLRQAAQLDPPVFVPAIDALLGQTPSIRRLTWMTSLPESLMHHEGAKLACLLPDWDARRGRVFLDYLGKEFHFEMATGKTVLLSGRWKTSLHVDGIQLKPVTDWELTCEYTDDDVHYLEFEQSYDDGFAVQRQVALIREDRCCLIADAIVQTDYRNAPENSERRIEYRSTIPISDSVTLTSQDDLTEMLFKSKTSQGLLLPLAADEWTTAPSSQRLSVNDEGELQWTDRGVGQLFSPLWIDLNKKRFSSKRTWRQLTVAEQLEPVPHSTASAFRIQSEASQWILYRSLHEGGPRSFFGKQMIVDFFAARFYAHDQSWEELVVVEGSEDHE
ncbi:hypothetical protein [Roseiconus lacunae]|uniref:Heparinase n=1 Tax=Roseiconus lacunae TaxID=2605694 RepID=A0ABT7PI56_9BACT|nr:hypothetical protein [Roseiconus lacunae]MDM4016175.1 hypothetical protein [Roseiconus lacunae]